MCEYCKPPSKSIELHRRENLGCLNPYILKCRDDELPAMFFENAKGMPAYMEIRYCPFCGRDMKS